MNWIKSGGGPLVCVESHLAHNWGGDTPTGSGDYTDYERACAQTDYLSAITIEGGTALILGDMPLRTTVLTSAAQVTIGRLFYAPKNFEIEHTMASVDDAMLVEPIETLLLTVQRGDFLLFDSAISGRTRKPDCNTLHFALRRGRFRAITKTLNPAADVSLLIHRSYPVV